MGKSTHKFINWRLKELGFNILWCPTFMEIEGFELIENSFYFILILYTSQEVVSNFSVKSVRTVRKWWILLTFMSSDHCITQFLDYSCKNSIWWFSDRPRNSGVARRVMSLYEKIWTIARARRQDPPGYATA